jgi:hypothetical protein
MTRRTTRQAARPHRHSWQAISIGSDGRILEGCTVDRCTATRIGDDRAVGLWDGVELPGDSQRNLSPQAPGPGPDDE